MLVIYLTLITAGVREMLQAADIKDKLDCRNSMYLSIHDAVVSAMNKYPSIRNQVRFYYCIYFD